MKPFSRLMPAIAGLLALASAAAGWSAAGHRTITLLALDGLPQDMPVFLRDPEVRARIADQSTEPDRWRGTRAVPIAHEANPEHYIDVEELDAYGLTLATLPEHRYEFLRRMAIVRDRNPEAFKPAGRDPDKTKDWPGFLPYAINEHYAKLQSSFNSLRILEAVNDPSRRHQLTQARENVIYEMGILSHFVGDASQPLHTTMHHHGWVGDNPAGYTTDPAIHAYIDGRIVEIHGLDFAALRPRMAYDLAPEGGWRTGLDEIDRSFRTVERLYSMKKDGSLEQPAGRDFIASRLCDGARTLQALYAAAWAASAPTQGQIGSFIKYSELPGAVPAPSPPAAPPEGNTPGAPRG
jgi:hypothetical protein